MGGVATPPGRQPSRMDHGMFGLVNYATTPWREQDGDPSRHFVLGLLFAGEVEQDHGEDGAADRHEGEKPVGFAKDR